MSPEKLEKLRKLFGYKFPRWGPIGYRWFLKNRPRQVQAELFPGISIPLDLDDVAQRTFYYYGERYEFPTGQILLEWCQHASYFFDIGANFGFFSLLLKSKKLSVNIIAFEPNPIILKQLRSTIDANNLKNFRVESIGLSDERSILPLHPGKENNGQSTFGNHPELSKETVAHVEVMPFDEYCESNGLVLPSSPEWVAKIDVEGFDLKVLQGMRLALERKAFKGISVEVNEFNLNFCETSANDLRAFMKASGYRALLPKEQPGGGSSTDNDFYVPANSNR